MTKRNRNKDDHKDTPETSTPKSGLEGAVPNTDQTVAPVITVSDFEKMIAIINVASERGAFKPNELTSVGGIYDKLVNFLNYVHASNQQQQNSAENSSSQKKQ